MPYSPNTYFRWTNFKFSHDKEINNGNYVKRIPFKQKENVKIRAFVQKLPRNKRIACTKIQGKSLKNYLKKSRLIFGKIALRTSQNPSLVSLYQISKL